MEKYSFVMFGVAWVFCQASSGLDVRMSVGEAKELVVDGYSDVNISRRGVVDVSLLNGDVWRITGLKKGVVVVSWVNEEGATVERMIVQVFSRPKTNEPLDALLCGSTGISCDENSRFISGQTSNWALWLAIAERCEEAGGCLFGVSLGGDGRAKLQKYFRGRHGEGYQLQWGKNGAVHISGVCGEASLLKLKDWLGRYAAAFSGTRCLPPDVNALHLNTKVIVHSQKEASKKGLSGDFSDVAAVALPKRHELFLSWVSEQGSAEVVSQPELRVAEGVESEVLGGGEFQIPYKNNDGKQHHWKPFGVKLSGVLTELSSGQKGVQAKMTLSNRGAEGTLSSYGFSGFIGLENREYTLVGASELRSEEQVTQRPAGFAAIPILGVLFRLDRRVVSKAILSVWMKLTAQNES